MTALLLFHALVVGVLAAVALHALLNHVTFPRVAKRFRSLLNVAGLGRFRL